MRSINTKPLFRHLVAQVFSSQARDSFDKKVEKNIDLFVSKLNLKEVDRLKKSFSPQGTTFVLVLSSSHLAIHTWPENNFIHIDLLTCSNTSEEDFKSAIKIFGSVEKSIEII